MTQLAFSREGTGTPLVMLHGIGNARSAWEPIIPALAGHFDVIAVDLPGHGDSAPLPAVVEPHPAALAASVAALLDDLRIRTPHVVGNSLGGWVALELAAARPVTSVVLLSPAGLWRNQTPVYTRINLRITRWLATHATDALSRLVRYRLARMVILGQTHGRPSRIDPDYARRAIRAMGSSPGFERTMKAAQSRSYVAGPPINAPVTVAFGSRDHILLRWQSRRIDQLPPRVHVEALPGCGHVPMADDPQRVASLIIRATSLPDSAGSASPSM
jgi:pimeloyl-ACP methyl ester carboxylesterase